MYLRTKKVNAKNNSKVILTTELQHIFIDSVYLSFFTSSFFYTGHPLLTVINFFIEILDVVGPFVSSKKNYNLAMMSYGCI